MHQRFISFVYQEAQDLALQTQKRIQPLSDQELLGHQAKSAGD